MRTYCVKQKKLTECVPESERITMTSNGRQMIACICAECGATKTQFVKSKQTGGAVGDFACGYKLKGKRAGTINECFKKGQVRYWGLNKLDDGYIDVLLADRDYERKLKRKEKSATKTVKRKPTPKQESAIFKPPTTKWELPKPSVMEDIMNYEIKSKYDQLMTDARYLQLMKDHKKKRQKAKVKERTPVRGTPVYDIDVPETEPLPRQIVEKHPARDVMKDINWAINALEKVPIDVELGIGIFGLSKKNKKDFRLRLREDEDGNSTDLTIYEGPNKEQVAQIIRRAID